jgi:hypothetical protein
VKKKQTLTLPADKVRGVRRKARALAGAVPPARIETPKPLRPPKHKKKIEDGEN